MVNSWLDYNTYHYLALIGVGLLTVLAGGFLQLFG